LKLTTRADGGSSADTSTGRADDAWKRSRKVALELADVGGDALDRVTAHLQQMLARRTRRSTAPA
jgi:hypothetical protein